MVDATPERIFEVLSDPENYGYWVVGSKEIRDADHDWPAEGSKFHHTVGFGPLTISDHSCVEEDHAPSNLQLRVKARPMGTGRVKLKMVPVGSDKTEVTMIEDAADRLTALLFNPLTHLLVRGRNEESLRRLGELAELP
ncbi:MAG: SRPBCC family protein [Solirubrobacterales bacterium]